MVNVTIASYKRAHKLVGYDYFKMAKIVAPHSQRDEYFKTVAKDRLIIIPDKDDGHHCRKRNWILRNITRPVLILDDDVKMIIHTEGGEHFRRNGRAMQQIPLPADRVEWFIENGFNLAYSWGVPFWGINCTIRTDEIINNTSLSR